jgi:hypothetical protein
MFAPGRASVFAPTFALAAGIVVSVGAAARADEGVMWNGSVAGRALLTTPSDHALLSTRDQPVLGALFETNVQARGQWFDRTLSLVSDASLFLAGGAVYADLDADGVLVAVADHDVVAHRPRLVLSEVRLRWDPFEHVNVTVGKQRVVWGAGFANNPTDVLNPPRDPTDPAFQRAGVWLARVDAPFEHVTFSAFVAPAVLLQANGLPVAMLRTPDFDFVGGPPRDDDLHWAAAARAYALVADTDVNVWAVWKDRYGDDVEGRAQGMVSVSRLVGAGVELHGEALLQKGSARVATNPDCVVDDAALRGCALAGTSPLDRDLVDDTALFPRVLVGGRYMPADESLLSIEYLYAADGLDVDAFGNLVFVQKRAGQAQRAGIAVPLPSPGAGADGLPARFGFDVVRRHYLFASYQRPHTLHEDLTVGATLVTALEDLSSVASASATFSARDWLQVSAFAFVPVPSLDRAVPDNALQAFVDGLARTDPLRAWLPSTPTIDDERWGAFDGVPFALRGVVEVRAFF